MAVPVSMDEILKYVQNCSYPTDYNGIVSCARQNNAPQDIIQALIEMKDDTSRVHYSGPNDVRDEVERHRRHVSR